MTTCCVCYKSENDAATPVNVCCFGEQRFVEFENFQVFTLKVHGALMYLNSTVFMRGVLCTLWTLQIAMACMGAQNTGLVEYIVVWFEPCPISFLKSCASMHW